MTVIEAIEPSVAPPVAVTVMVATPVTTVPSGFNAVAEITVVPWLTAVTTPVPALTVATPGALDVQTAGRIVAAPTIADWLVRLTVVPVPVVAMA